MFGLLLQILLQCLFLILAKSAKITKASSEPQLVPPETVVFTTNPGLITFLKYCLSSAGSKNAGETHYLHQKRTVRFSNPCEVQLPEGAHLMDIRSDHIPEQTIPEATVVTMPTGGPLADVIHFDACTCHFKHDGEQHSVCKYTMVMFAGSSIVFDTSCENVKLPQSATVVYPDRQRRREKRRAESFTLSTTAKVVLFSILGVVVALILGGIITWVYICYMRKDRADSAPPVPASAYIQDDMPIRAAVYRHHY